MCILLTLRLNFRWGGVWNSIWAFFLTQQSDNIKTVPSLLGVDHREHNQQELEANLVSHLDQGDQDRILIMFGTAFEHSYSLRNNGSKNTIQMFGSAFEHSHPLHTCYDPQLGHGGCCGYSLRNGIHFNIMVQRLQIQSHSTHVWISILNTPTIQC